MYKIWVENLRDDVEEAILKDTSYKTQIQIAEVRGALRTIRYLQDMNYEIFNSILKDY